MCLCPTKSMAQLLCAFFGHICICVTYAMKFFIFTVFHKPFPYWIYWYDAIWYDMIWCDTYYLLSKVYRWHITKCAIDICFHLVSFEDVVFIALVFCVNMYRYTHKIVLVFAIINHLSFWCFRQFRHKKP